MSSYTSLILGENIASENKLSNSDINCNKNEQAKNINNVSSFTPLQWELRDNRFKWNDHPRLYSKD